MSGDNLLFLIGTSSGYVRGEKHFKPPLWVLFEIFDEHLHSFSYGSASRDFNLLAAFDLSLNIQTCTEQRH